MKTDEKLRCGLQLAAIACAVAFIAIGFSRGEAAAVLIKAINICMECIGLG